MTATVPAIRHRDARTLVAALVVARVVPAVAVTVSILHPWTSSGLASAAPARRLADLALSGHAGELVTPWIGRSWYALAAAGAVGIALAPLDVRWVRAARAGACGVVWVCLVAVWIGLGIDAHSLGTGAALAAAGAFGSTATVVVDTWMRRQR